MLATSNVRGAALAASVSDCMKVRLASNEPPGRLRLVVLSLSSGWTYSWRA